MVDLLLMVGCRLMPANHCVYESEAVNLLLMVGSNVQLSITVEMLSPIHPNDVCNR